MDFIFKEQLKDFKDVFQKRKKKSDILKKYKLSESTYAKYKKRFVTKYDIHPFELYSFSSILQCPEILQYCLEQEIIAEEDVKKAEEEGKFVNRSTPKKAGITNFEKANGINSDETLQYIVKGKSTYYDSEGNIKGQWIKESLNEKEYQLSLKKAIETLCENLPLSPKINLSKEFRNNRMKDSMSFLPLADMHLGLHIDKNSVNHDFDWNLEIAEKVFRESTDYILSSLPKTHSIVIADLGDLTHNHNNENKTARSGHHLDVDGRYETIILKTFELIIELIYKALSKFNKVYFYSIAGNHNDMLSTPLKCVIRHHFKNDPRVILDINNFSNVQYHYFGKNLLMFHHGDDIKAQNIESVMFADNLDKISSYNNFDAWLGHYHTEKQQQRGLVTVRYVKNFIPNDKWSMNMGFRNSRNVGYMKAYVYDKDQGIISSIGYNPITKYNKNIKQ